MHSASFPSEIWFRILGCLQDSDLISFYLAVKEERLLAVIETAFIHYTRTVV